MIRAAAFILLICLGVYCAAGFMHNTPPPLPGIATRAVAESETLGPAGRYFVDTFFANPLDKLFWMLVIGLVLFALVGAALGDGN